MERIQTDFFGFEDGGVVPRTKKCRWPLKAENGKETFPLEPLEKIQVC